MSGGRYIKEAMIAALCEHPKQDDYSKRAFDINHLPQKVGLESLTKEDFLTPDADGVYIIDTPGFWKNFDKVLDILGKNGEVFTFDDFMKPFDKANDRNLLESALEFDGLEKLFAFETWKGRFDDMDLLWYHVPFPLRKELFKNEGLIDLNLKSQLLAFEGLDVPEEGLEKAGLSMKDIFNAFSERGNYEDVKRKLAQAGDHLRKNYLLLTDADGDTVFHMENTWQMYNDIAATLAKNGERLDAADFLRRVGNRQDILDRGASHNQLHKIFTPELWAGHLSEMVDLWEHIKPGWRVNELSTEKFDGYYATAEDKTYVESANFAGIEKKADLFKILNEGKEQGADVIPLGLKSFWDHLSDIEKRLDTKKESITLGDLRKTSGELNNSCLMNAIKGGHFDKVISIAQKTGEQITLEDLLTKDRHGNSVLNILAEQNELSKVFSPVIWAGRVTDMKKLWTYVRYDDRQQVNFLEAEVSAKQATLKSKSKRKGRFKL